MAKRGNAEGRRAAELELLGKLEKLIGEQRPGLCFVDKSDIYNGVTASTVVAGTPQQNGVIKRLANAIARECGAWEVPRRVAWMKVDVQHSHTIVSVLLELNIVA